MTPPEIDLRPRVRSVMLRCALSKTDMGTLLGISRQAFGQWLSRKPKPLDLKIAALLAEIEGRTNIFDSLGKPLHGAESVVESGHEAEGETE